MRWISKQTVVWMLGASLAHAETLALHEALPAAGMPDQAHWWPWLALGGILALLASIALGARRCSPFGRST